MQAIPAGLPNVCLSTQSNSACVIAVEAVDPEPCLVTAQTQVDCKQKDKEGNWIYSFSTILTSNLTFPTSVSLSSPDATFFGLSPVTLPPGSGTNITSNFYTTLNAGDTLCAVIELTDAEGRTVCKEQVCIVIPPCDDKTECDCPFDIKLDEFSVEQKSGTDFLLTGLVGTSGANLKRYRATIISSVITQDCDGKITSYNSGSVFTGANSWAGNNPSGIGTSSLTWDADPCETLDGLSQDYQLDIPFMTAKDCRLNVKLCIRYEFLDCECRHCEEVVCIDFVVKNPISGLISESQEDDRVSSTIRPNPADSWMKIDYTLEVPTEVTIRIIDLKGSTIALLADKKPMTAGSHSIGANTGEIPSGAYMYIIETVDGTHLKPFIISR
jgi:hypothetical protein